MRARGNAKRVDRELKRQDTVWRQGKRSTLWPDYRCLPAESEEAWIHAGDLSVAAGVPILRP